jgi:hypothetical protein
MALAEQSLVDRNLKDHIPWDIAEVSFWSRRDGNDARMPDDDGIDLLHRLLRRAVRAEVGFAAVRGGFGELGGIGCTAIRRDGLEVRVP